MRSTVVRMLLFLGCLLFCPWASEAEGPLPSAKDLASRLAALQEGTSYVRLRLDVRRPADTEKITLQIQIKERIARGIRDVVYQILWPKERKGESVLLHQADGAPSTGTLFIPPDKLNELGVAQMKGALFESDLSYEDVIENFFAWENQSIVGSEVLNRVNCLVLESRPAKGDSSAYANVRSWIDPHRFVPLRVEKYLAGGKLARRIETTRVVTDDKGRSIPADLTVTGPREDSVTNLDGSRLKHDVVYSDLEFTPDGIRKIAPTLPTE